jgi:hypothetical protein
VLVGPIAEAKPKIGVFSHTVDRVPSRIDAIGFSTTTWTLDSQITLSALNGVDVLYVTNERADLLSQSAELINQWVQLGNGLIVEQPNRSGPVAIMPPGLGVTVLSGNYVFPLGSPESAVLITPEGAAHPITAGLSTELLSGNGDLVRKADVSPNFEILGVQISYPDFVALAAASYGEGRVVFHTGNIHPLANRPGSDRYVRQMLNWAAAVPEPTSTSLICILIASIFTSQLRRRRNQTNVV